MSFIEHYDKASFEEMVVLSFGFVEAEAGMIFGSVEKSGGRDSRDAALIARYSGQDFRFDVGWSEYELSLCVLIYFKQLNVPRGERYVYFEPFVEYLTDGDDKAIVPYVTESMSIKKIESTIEQRQVVFCDGLLPVIKKVWRKFQFYMDQMKTTSAEHVNGYHHWMRSKR